LRIAPGIEAYGGGGFRIAGRRYEGGVLILDDEVHPWPVTDLKTLTPEALALAFASGLQAVEFVLLGTGAVLAPAPRAVRDAVRASGFGLEVLNTIEACRLYNLMAEDGRRVAAGLIAI
jgi:uncharacterized protein